MEVQQAQVAQLMAVAKRWHAPMLANCFNSWREAASRQFILRDRLQIAASRWRCAALAKAFSTWRHQASVKAALSGCCCYLK